MKKLFISSIKSSKIVHIKTSNLKDWKNSKYSTHETGRKARMSLLPFASLWQSSIWALNFWILLNVGLRSSKKRHENSQTLRTMQPRGAATCATRHVPFLSLDLTNFPVCQVNIRSTKTFTCSTGGLSKRTKAKDIRGQLVCLTGGSIPVTMFTRKLFAELTLEIP